MQKKIYIYTQILFSHLHFFYLWIALISRSLEYDGLNLPPLAPVIYSMEQFGLLILLTAHLQRRTFSVLGRNFHLLSRNFIFFHPGKQRRSDCDHCKTWAAHPRAASLPAQKQATSQLPAAYFMPPWSSDWFFSSTSAVAGGRTRLHLLTFNVGYGSPGRRARPPPGRQPTYGARTTWKTQSHPTFRGF